MPANLFKDTGNKKGRNIYITPENSDLKFLSFARIILDEEISSVKVESKKNEVSLVCLKGEGLISVDDLNYSIQQYDSLYIPIEKEFVVTTNTKIDIAESYAPSSKKGNPSLVTFNSVRNSKYYSDVGKETYKRELFKLIDKNIDAMRLSTGITFGKAGNWTNWPPNEHTGAKEKIYLFINMPKPSFGIQLIYNNLEKMEFIQPVFENDAVVISHGFHPNTGIPGYGINFVWMMASLDADADRNWTGKKFQEEFLGKY